jgi:hypothetical protein
MHFTLFSIAESNQLIGGPGGYTGWVYTKWVRKTIRFWQKRSPNYDFLVLHSLSTLSTSKNI